jgi:hypothetical protein
MNEKTTRRNAQSQPGSSQSDIGLPMLLAISVGRKMNSSLRPSAGLSRNFTVLRSVFPEDFTEMSANTSKAPSSRGFTLSSPGTSKTARHLSSAPDRRRKSTRWFKYRVGYHSSRFVTVVRVRSR